MARILSIDYGRKRCGIAVTDPLQIIVNGLETVERDRLIDYLKDYFISEEVEKIVLGEPFHPDGNPAQMAPEIRNFAKKLKKIWPEIEVVLHDESYTSSEAEKILVQTTKEKERRQNKGLVDRVSAVLILQDYLNHI